MLVSFSGRTAAALPDDDAELWLTLATSVASPQGDPLSEEDREFARAMEWAEDEDLKFGEDLDEPGADSEPDELSAAIAAVCALDHFDWLAVMSALVTGGPGTPASAADLARYVRDFDPDEVIGLKVAGAGDAVRDEDEDTEFGGQEFAGGDLGGYEDDFDELSIEGLFLHVTAMWSVLGAIDEDDRLTPLAGGGSPRPCAAPGRNSGSTEAGLRVRRGDRLSRARRLSARPRPRRPPSRPGVPPGPRSGRWLAASLAPSASVPSGSSGFGPILRNCLFIERSRKTSASPSTATTRKPSRPGSTSLIVEVELAARYANVTGAHSPEYPRKGHLPAARYRRAT